LAVHAYLDASALAKRFVPEIGTPVVNHLFQTVPAARLSCLHVGALEVVSILVRKRNARRIGSSAFAQAMLELRAQVFDLADFEKVPVTDDLIDHAVPLVVKHSVNSNDALVLRSAVELAGELQSEGNSLILVASDLRLLRAAQAEGLTAFNPETQSESDLDALIGP
jgi:uncharacterized protein